MKFVALTSVAVAAVAVLAMGAAPAVAAPDDYTTVVTTPPAEVQSTDQARQDYYQNQLNAAQAQTRADQAMAQADQALSERDQALADRDAAQDRAYDDRAIREDQRDDTP
ncbi:MAG TPA: hypothetical protein VH019_09200 [Rhizomicrobium sp.]|nr:hypothetical protein [Rhizomicrobium sp.]